MLTTVENMKEAMMIGNTVAYLDIEKSLVIPLTVQKSKSSPELSDLELFGIENGVVKTIPVLDHVLEKEVTERKLFLTAGEAFACLFKQNAEPPSLSDDETIKERIKSMSKDEFIDYLFQEQHDAEMSESVRVAINERAKEIFGEDMTHPEFTQRILMGKANIETKKDGFIIDQRIKNDPDYAASFATGYIENDQTISKLHESIDDLSLDNQVKDLIISAIGAIGKLKTINKHYESALHQSKEAMRKNLVYAAHKDEMVLLDAIKAIEHVLKNNKKDDEV